jgi:enterochelin esterase family protein
MNESVERFRSVNLKNERSVWICKPVDPPLASNLTVFLDGEFYRDRIGAKSVIEKLQGRIADSWFVFVSMESLEARAVECPCYPPFAKFIVEELLPWLVTRCGGRNLNSAVEAQSACWRSPLRGAGASTAESRMTAIRHITLAGLSYSGLAAAFVAKEFPGVFQKVICQSGSFWWNDCWLVEQYRLQPPLPAGFYLDVGSLEVEEDDPAAPGAPKEASQIEGVRRFRDVLLQKGNPVKYREFDGGHDFDSWRKTLPGALKWALAI